MCSSFDFVANQPPQSLGFILWDAGYDVWMLNARGNIYSSDSAKSRQRFYEYTWDELAAFDLPANIDYILTTTGHRNLHLMSHSRGTTVTIAMLASKPDYNDKVRLATMLAPVVYLDGMSQFLQNIVKFFSNPVISYAVDVLTEGGPLFSNAHNDPSYFTLNPTLCSLELCPITNDLSGNFFTSSGHHNKSRLAVYSTHFPAGTTFNDLKHYIQLHKTKRFAYYDFEDPWKNIKAYGTARPPAYNLQNVRAKMLIFYAKNDSFISVRDGRKVVERFRDNLYKDTAIELPHAGFVHMDFLWSIKAKEQLYDTIIKRMREIDGETPQS
ncbi:lipase 3-like isoform X2 [Varroa destructor]|nr:lipase 3-like isoform X2 [Varroa destructor]XP_022671435.1 lipase 3-like isoform X2 [Varroa destructor]